MRSFTAALLALAVALPLGVATAPAHADEDGYTSQYQTPSWRGDNDWRGRHDEWRNEHAQRDWDHRDEHADRDQWPGDNGWDNERHQLKSAPFGYQPRSDEGRWAETDNGDRRGDFNNGWRRDEHGYGDQDHRSGD